MISIGVVAHIKRGDQAADLMHQVGAVYRSVDNGSLGCEQNHRKVWAYLANTGSEWGLVLEDDAIPCDNFRAQAEQALTASPADVVSFYLGAGRPIWFELAGRGSAQKLQPLIREALTHDTAFILAPKLFHAVAVAIRTKLIPDMLHTTRDSRQPIDFAIGDWCTTKGHTVAYTNPSLVDHDDGPTVIRKHHDGEPRLQPRQAHQVGTRTTWPATTYRLGDTRE